MIIDFPWYFVLLCLLAGAVYAAALYAFGRRPFARWLLWLLSVLRFVAVSAIVFLLLAPVSRQKVSERQRPRVAFLDDASLSVGLSADSSFSLAALHDDMDDRLDVTYETFGNQGATDIGEALMRHRYDDMAAVVIATDGIYNRGSNPSTLAEQLGCPVYTIALGDTSLHRDATLADLRASRITILGNNFKFSIPFSIFESIDRRIAENAERLLRKGLYESKEQLYEWALERVGYKAAMTRRALNG